MNNDKIAALEKKITNNYNNIIGLVVLKDGHTRYEKYFNDSTAANTVHVYSVTKSIISILIGIAIDQGYIKNVNQKVSDFFPDHPVIKKNKTIKQITLKNLLTMTTPYRYKIAPFAYIRYFMSSDWLNFTLNLLDGKKQAGEFKYTPIIGPDILSGILMKTTGQSVFDFANKNLFVPLGITLKDELYLHNAKQQQEFNKSKDISGWVVDATGLNPCGWGLTLSANDMAKIGQLYLQKGIWNNQQIVSKEWVSESIKEHSCWKKLNLAYGYLWWINDDGFAAMGDAGNVIYVNTKKNMVISIVATAKSKVNDRIDFIKADIEPLFSDHESIT